MSETNRKELRAIEGNCLRCHRVWNLNLLRERNDYVPGKCPLCNGMLEPVGYMEVSVYDHKLEFKTKLEFYIGAKSFTETEKTEYIKKLLRDKEYSQKLLFMKANNRTIEIEVLREMLVDAK